MVLCLLLFLSTSNNPSPAGPAPLLDAEMRVSDYTILHYATLHYTTLHYNNDLIYYTIGGARPRDHNHFGSSKAGLMPRCQVLA